MAKVAPNAIVLIDCLTLWLSNQMQAEVDIDNEIAKLLTALSASPNPVICVSNEVGMGLVPDTPLGRQFRNLQGRLNRKIAERSDLAVFVVAGLPLTLKGTLPEGIE